MKLLKKLLLALSVGLVLSLLFGYLYFDQKFTPDENYLIVKNESGKVPITWDTHSKSAMLLPIHFEEDTTNYYLQFDTGSPYTIFYGRAISEIKQISVNGSTAASAFTIGNCTVQSNKFKVINFGDSVQHRNLKIIGTIGTDILENRKTVLNFRNNYLVINASSTPAEFKHKLSTFDFKKRKIIIPAILAGKKEKFLYDTGTSAYELLSTKDIWEKLRLSDANIKKEEGKSWNNTLYTYTTASDESISFEKTMIPLNEITYVEGYSKAQYYMMKFSGMSGMMGNKIFLKNQIFIDAENMKIGID